MLDRTGPTGYFRAAVQGVNARQGPGDSFPGENSRFFVPILSRQRAGEPHDQRRMSRGLISPLPDVAILSRHDP